MAHTVFICHSAKDKQVADAACAALEAHDIPCWIAPRNVLGGTEWGGEIVEAIAVCQVVVLIFSGNANSSEPVRREIELALNRKKIVIPFRIEDIQPSGALEYALINLHWLDAITQPLEKSLNNLCRNVERIIERRQPSTPLWQPAPAPVTEPAPSAKEADELRRQREPLQRQVREAGQSRREAQPAPLPDSTFADEPAEWRRARRLMWIGGLATVVLIVAAIPLLKSTRSQPSATGALTVQTTPNAQVSLDGQPRGTADGSGRFTISPLSVGTHTVNISADQYEPVSGRSIAIGANQVANLVQPLTALSPCANLAAANPKPGKPVAAPTADETIGALEDDILQTEEARDGINDALDRFEKAYNSRNLSDVTANWLNIGATRCNELAGTFKTGPMRNVREKDCSRPAVSGNAATLNCLETYQDSGGHRALVYPMTITFSKVEGKWVIWDKVPWKL